MELKEGYKKTEVGVIPEDWKVGRLDTYWAVIDCKHITAQFIGDGIPLASITEVQSLFVDLKNAMQTTMYFYEKLIEGGRKPSSGDLIFSRNATVGEVAQVMHWHPPFAMGQDVCLLKKRRPTYSTIYLQTVIRSPIIRKQLDNLMVGSTFKRVNIEQIRNFVIPLPSPIEQTAIATALSDADALISRLETLIDKKRAIKQGAMQQLLKPKEGWVVKKLGEVAEVRDGTHQTPKYVEAGIPFYSVESVTANDFSNTKFITHEAHKLLTKNFRIEKGDILMTRIGSIGDCKYIDWNVDASFYVSLALLKIKKEYSAQFICQYSETSEFKVELDLNSLQHAIPKKINLGQISHIEIKLPEDKEEQTRIAQILSDMDAEITGLEQKLAKYKRLKQGMMQELLTGKTRLV